MLDEPSSAPSIHRVGNHDVPEDWPVVGETSRRFVANLRNGVYAAYMAGDVVLHVGYRGAFENAVPVLPHAIGVDTDYPGYDGVRLPFTDGSVDAVYSSHMLSTPPPTSRRSATGIGCCAWADLSCASFRTNSSTKSAGTRRRGGTRPIGFAGCATAMPTIYTMSARSITRAANMRSNLSSKSANRRPGPLKTTLRRAGNPEP